MQSDHYIEETNLSVAWAKALQAATQLGRNEVSPLIVSITEFDGKGAFTEVGGLRDRLDKYLACHKKQTIETVANTIFPASFWNKSAPRGRLYERYLSVLPRLKKASPMNRRGLYFERMITGGPPGKENQLDFSIANYTSRRGTRRSTLQVAIFDPHKDHSSAARLMFPCLQHVTFAPGPDGLSINAFYAMQYLVERAYGNYVGLCRLGQFVAHELQLPLVRMTCFCGIAKCDVPKNGLQSILCALKDNGGCK